LLKKIALSLGAMLAIAAIGMARADVTATLNVSGSLGGNYGGYVSGGLGVANDGTVVGDAMDGNNDNIAFVWSSSGGIVNIDTTGQGVNSYSQAFGISPDGGTVVGAAVFGNAGSNQNAFIWTHGGGMVNIDTTGQGANSLSYANAVSPNGSVVVGQAFFGTGIYQTAFRWTQATGMVDIDNTGEGIHSASAAYGVSADGSIVVGGAKFANASSSWNAFIWTQGTGMVNIDTTGQGANSNSDAFAVSADGSTVAGAAVFGNAGNQMNAFVWKQSTGMVNIDTSGAGTNSSSVAYGISGDGRVIVGNATFDGVNQTAFRWTQAKGMQNLGALLSNAGVNMTNITLNGAYAVSPNGTLITGDATFPDGNDYAYLARYDDGAGGGGIAGLTTVASQRASTQQLADHAVSAMAQSRATASELLGMTRPMNGANYVQAGGMFGSAVGYVSSQYSARGFTLLGGLAYGEEDYPNIKQGGAATVAAAMRYTFDDPFGDEGGVLHPYGEIGGWVTPQATLALSRTYVNGAGTATGVGSTSATTWAYYGRSGLMWDVTKADSLTGYGELGQQSMAFAGYSEAAGAGKSDAGGQHGAVVRQHDDANRYRAGRRHDDGGRRRCDLGRIRRAHRDADHRSLGGRS